ncbi:MAG: amidase family protein [Defluviitaleaceae bacterium]|nr:amidase family protein [Defluviitaleaceae bacterium]
MKDLMRKDFYEMTIPRFHEALERGIFTCEELIKFYLWRIESLDRQINSIIAINSEAITRAKELDAVYAKNGLCGPLHGVPVLLKDNCETFDMPTTAGSKSLEGWLSGSDAAVTQKLREAGAIILAKVNLHEFAIWGETISSILGQTINPYDFTRTAGGSSGGTGAAIAADFGLVGIGTDTINSIRSPSSANSLCGIRPTVGLCDTGGIVSYSNTQDVVGPMARTVEDAVRTLDVIANHGRRPASYIISLKPGGLKNKRIGVLESFFGKNQENEPVNQVVKPALSELEKAGVQLVSVCLPIDSAWLTTDVSVHLYELKEYLAEYLTQKQAPVRSIDDILASGKYSTNIKDVLLAANGLGTGMTEYSRRLELAGELRQSLLELFKRESLDALVFPHQQQLVCKIGGKQAQRNGVLASVLGWPSIVVPCGFSPDEKTPVGIPVGIEFMARPFEEPALIEIAYGFEQSTPARLRPYLSTDSNTVAITLSVSDAAFDINSEEFSHRLHLISGVLAREENIANSLAPLLNGLFDNFSLPHNVYSEFLAERAHRFFTVISSGEIPDSLLGKQMAGCGQGLTPSSDDFLVGVSAALYGGCAAYGLETTKEQCHALVMGAVPHTTSISAFFLRNASNGYFNERIARLMTAFFASDSHENLTSAAKELCEMGATSGMDTLAGICFGLKGMKSPIL